MATTATIARIAAMTVSIGNFEVCCGSGSGVDVPDGVGDGVGVGGNVEPVKFPNN